MHVFGQLFALFSDRTHESTNKPQTNSVLHVLFQKNDKDKSQKTPKKIPHQKQMWCRLAKWQWLHMHCDIGINMQLLQNAWYATSTVRKWSNLSVHCQNKRKGKICNKKKQTKQRIQKSKPLNYAKKCRLCNYPPPCT